MHRGRLPQNFARPSRYRYARGRFRPRNVERLDLLVLKSKQTRRAFPQDPSHQISFVYAPRYSSWLSQVEIWFSILARRLLKRARSTSIDVLRTRVLDFVA